MALFAKDYYQTKIATIVVLTLLSLIVFAILGFVVYLFVLQRKRQIEVSNSRKITLELENQFSIKDIRTQLALSFCNIDIFRLRA